MERVNINNSKQFKVINSHLDTYKSIKELNELTGIDKHRIYIILKLGMVNDVISRKMFQTDKYSKTPKRKSVLKYIKTIIIDI